MTDCARLEDAFSEWLDGAMDPALGPLMETHLAACAPCRLRIQEYGEMRRLLRSLEDAPARPPEEILRNVLRVVTPGEIPPSSETVSDAAKSAPAAAPAPGASPAAPPRSPRSRTGPALIGTAIGAILSIPVALWAARMLEPARPAAGVRAPGAVDAAPVDVSAPDPQPPPSAAGRVPPAPALPPHPAGEKPEPAPDGVPGTADAPQSPPVPAPPVPLPLATAEGDLAPAEPGSPPAEPPSHPAQTEPGEPRPIRPAGVLEGTADIVVRVTGRVVLDTTDDALVRLLKDLVRETSVRAELTTEIRADTLRITIVYHGKSLAHVENFENKARKILDANPGSASSVAWYRNDR